MQAAVKGTFHATFLRTDNVMLERENLHCLCVVYVPYNASHLDNTSRP